MNAVKRIGMIVFEGADMVDFAGPMDVFHTAGRLLARTKADPPYVIELLSLEGGLVRTLQDVRVETGLLTEPGAGDYDTIILSGGLNADVDRHPGLVDWLRRNHRCARRVASVCTGAFFLARTGLLDGRRATTHWDDCDVLQADFPAIRVERDSIFVADDGVWTAAGITSGIDMALAMVEEDLGHELALSVARNMVVFLKRPGGQSQFSVPLRAQSVEGPLAPLLQWIGENPAADLRIEALADRAAMSPRNFHRAFQNATGMSPAGWVELSRMELARRLLEQTSDHVDQVARKAGFATYEQMRRTFARRLGITPSDYRARFARPPSPERQAGVGLIAGLLEPAPAAPGSVSVH